MSRNQESELLAPLAGGGLLPHGDGTGTGGEGAARERPKRKKVAVGEHMKYHKPTSKRRALKVDWHSVWTKYDTGKDNLCAEAETLKHG